MSAAYNRKDHYYNRAKEESFRSRASFKLLELDKKYGLLKPGMCVLDLGAWPGGWLQVAAQKVGRGGAAVGIDLVALDPFEEENIHIIVGDARESENLEKAVSLAGRKFDVVISDMSPKLSGIKEVDRMAAIACSELALFAASQVLREGGNFVTKVFKSNETEEFVRSSRSQFGKFVRCELDSTRKTSNEFYLVGLGYRGTGAN